MTDSLPRLLTIDQLADQLGITQRHVRRLVAERRIPYVKVGRLIRFDPVDIFGWLDLARHAPATCPPSRPLDAIRHSNVSHSGAARLDRGPEAVGR